MRGAQDPCRYLSIEGTFEMGDFTAELVNIPEPFEVVHGLVNCQPVLVRRGFFVEMDI